MLGCADMGVCLHRSSSGIDLPMKISDMFGCGLPVCAVRYNCLDELVEEGTTGFMFDEPEHLASLFVKLLSGDARSLDKLRQQVISKYASKRWDSEWNRIVKPLITGTHDESVEIDAPKDR